MNKGEWLGLTQRSEQSPVQIILKTKGSNLSFCFTYTSLLVFSYYYPFTTLKLLQVLESSIKQYIPTVIARLNYKRE